MKLGKTSKSILNVNDAVIKRVQKQMVANKKVEVTKRPSVRRKIPELLTNNQVTKRPSVRRKISELTIKVNNLNNQNHNSRHLDKNMKNMNINRKNVPNKLKANCYTKGVSLYELHENKLVKKNISVIQKHCKDNNMANNNVKKYGVPPKPERVLAILKRNISKPSYKNAVRHANDPFYNFTNAKYLPVSPRPYSKKTWPKKHEVYNILPVYFPGMGVY